MENLSNDRWNELISQTEDSVIIDVRTPQECDEGIIAEAIHINFLAGNEFVSALEGLEKEKTYFIYCRSGNRSSQACNYMNMKGFKTYNLMNGIIGWDGKIVSN